MHSQRWAAMAPLSKNETLRVLDETDRLVRERARGRPSARRPADDR
jgi:hypothetical protein